MELLIVLIILLSVEANSSECEWDGGGNKKLICKVGNLNYKPQALPQVATKYIINNTVSHFEKKKKIAALNPQFGSSLLSINPMCLKIPNLCLRREKK